MRMEKAAALLLGCSLFAASSGVTSAYLRADPRALVNSVSAGSVYVKLTEPDWNPDQAQNLTPGDSVPKNPVVTNTGKSDAWIFLRVSVPVKRIRTVDPKTRRQVDAADRELFSFTADSGWEMVSRGPGSGTMEYVFGYKKPVAPSGTTSPLFEEVTLVNYLEGELLHGENLVMTVRAEAIQDTVCPPGAGLAEIYAYLPQ